MYPKYEKALVIQRIQTMVNEILTIMDERVAVEKIKIKIINSTDRFGAPISAVSPNEESVKIQYLYTYTVNRKQELNSRATIILQMLNDLIVANPGIDHPNYLIAEFEKEFTYV